MSKSQMMALGAPALERCRKLYLYIDSTDRRNARLAATVDISEHGLYTPLQLIE